MFLFSCISDGPNEVKIIPQIQLFIVNNTGSVGPIHCTAECQPLCEISWSGPSLSHHKTSILNLKNITISQAGVYQCTASNVLGVMRSSIVGVIDNHATSSLTIISQAKYKN